MLQSQEQTTFVFVMHTDTADDTQLLRFQCEFFQKQKHVNVVNDTRKEVYFFVFGLHAHAC